METLEQLGRTLQTMDDLQSIVRTMKALAAASIRQYERAALSLESYNRTVELGLHVVLRNMPEELPRQLPSRVSGAIVFGSDHGLCGRFNEDLATFATEHLTPRLRSGGVRVLAVGARMARRLAEVDLPVDRTITVAGSAAGVTTTVRDILGHIDGWRAVRVGSVHLLFSRHRSGSRSRPMAQRLLPLDLRRLHRLEDEPWPSHVLPTFTMPRNELFTALVRQYLFAMIFRASAESLAAEHASRLRAMQSAERNLTDRRAALEGEFRRRRQQIITAELLDVVAGFEVLRTS